MPIDILQQTEGADEVLRLLERAPDRVRGQAREAVQAASFAVEKRIKERMPVDTGRARASWGHWTPGDLEQPNEDAAEEDAHWVVRDGGLTIEQGSNVPYIAALNEGHSQQRRAGFIDRAARAGQRALINALRQLLEGF